jgi:hypothetical protein
MVGLLRAMFILFSWSKRSRGLAARMASKMLCIVVAFPVGARVHGRTTRAPACRVAQQARSQAARERMGVPYKSCCDAGDVYKTRFRIAADNSDQWQYFKDGKWKVIPPDVELCFFLPLGGI